MLEDTVPSPPREPAARGDRARALHAAFRAEGDAGVRMRVRGACMPGTFGGDDLVVVKRKPLYLPGDVVVVLGAGGDALAHRVIGWVPSRARGLALDVVTQADASPGPDRRVPLAAVLGRVEDARVSPRDRARALGRFATYAAGGALRRLGRGATP